jgi:ABC-type uncharacterized transport system substrate-binding protein
MIDCGNVTGFTAFEYDIGGKWLSLLKQFAPAIARVALLYNSNTAPWTDNFWRSFQATAPSFGVTPVQMNVRDAPAIEHAIEALAREPNGALLGVPEVTVTTLVSSSGLEYASLCAATMPRACRSQASYIRRRYCHYSPPASN